MFEALKQCILLGRLFRWISATPALGREVYSDVLGCVQVVLVARMVMDDEWIAAHVKAGRWRHRQLWLGTASTGHKRHIRDRLRRHRSTDTASPERDIEMGRGQ